MPPKQGGQKYIYSDGAEWSKRMDRKISYNGSIKLISRFFEYVYVFTTSFWKQKLNKI